MILMYTCDFIKIAFSPDVLIPMVVSISNHLFFSRDLFFKRDPLSNLIPQSCNFSFHRICWIVVKEDRETLDVEDLAGLLIDAESGIVLEKWIKGRLNSIDQMTRSISSRC